MPAHPAIDVDRWMDHDEVQPTQARSFRGFLSVTKEAPRRFIRFASTTPGRLTIVSFILIVAILAAGGAMVFSSEQRREKLDTLISQTEPLSNASQELFNALSEADSIATTSFLKQNDSDVASREQFLRATQRASEAVIHAGHGIDEISSDDMQLVLAIQNNLPNYVQLVSTAQTNDRLRNPVGVAYLTQGSELMQQQMLPAAQQLHERTSRKVTDERQSLVTPLWFPLSGLIAAVGFLLLAQLWLAALTNRRLNLGYVVATVLMVFATLWASASAAVTWMGTDDASNNSATSLSKLTQVRIAVQQARTNEALGLVQRDYSDQRHQQFVNSVKTIDATLLDIRDDVANPRRVDNARESLRGWDNAHALMVADLRNGEYGNAIRTALGDYRLTPGARSSEYSTVNFKILDEQLQALISDNRSRLQNSLIDGSVAAGRITNLVLSLTILAAVSCFLGTRPRLQEFL
ncbi:hypothetical protein [Corynebacterium auriscanis]|uniref:Membrane protein n=1 Tax=Corynebacterium auriscanis TaxID=99807 RepID=A0A0A2DL13_9CORY|nr:hypothetical protein [Corynebacterium auriscanis]KGM18629.1 membrane protein [Corynebacterium auriscanis]WJY72030.1 hypothetical protein CAURIC_01770 [Corynebacterium auriscanis]